MAKFTIDASRHNRPRDKRTRDGRRINIAFSPAEEKLLRRVAKRKRQPGILVINVEVPTRSISQSSFIAQAALGIAQAIQESDAAEIQSAKPGRGAGHPRPQRQAARHQLPSPIAAAL